MDCFVTENFGTNESVHTFNPDFQKTIYNHLNEGRYNSIEINFTMSREVQN